MPPLWCDTPPERKWLLTMPMDPVTGIVEGILPQGELGLLVGAGGSGKSIALIQLVLAVASGTPWLFDREGKGGIATVPSDGHILLVCAEEDMDEMLRRYYHAAQLAYKTLKLTPEQMAAADRRIRFHSLRGEDTLMSKNSTATEFYHDLYNSQKAADYDPPLANDRWSLIVFDPLARFADPDTEMDNAAATRFIQLMEAFTKLPGRPTVLLAHHSTKASRNGKDAVARGSSALSDAVRWQASWTVGEVPEPGEPQTAQMNMVKANYGAAHKFKLLRADHGLFVGNPKAKVVSREKRDLRSRILRVVHDAPEGVSKQAVEQHIGGQHAVFREEWQRLADDGVIREATRHRWVVTKL